jgi:hypothetical protein
MADDDIRACIDRLPPPPSRDERMALVKGAKWQPGDAIVVSFVDGDTALQHRVKTYAQAWTRHANLRLYFRQDPRADIRISFKQRGSWSHLGTFCRRIPADQPTMNFGWLRSDSSDDEVSRVVLHEFGHALGCIHEHQHPESGIRWKKQAVYDYYAGPPNHWTPAQVDRNLFQTYDKTLTLYSLPDPASIMMYPIDPRFTEDGFSVGLNRELSATDRDFIRTMYP